MKPARMLASLLLSATAAMAAATVNETRPVAPDARIAIEVISGSITVEGWDRPEIKVTGTLGESVSDLVIEGDRRRIGISVGLQEHRRHRNGDVQLDLRVPRGAELHVETVSAPLKVTGVAGALSVATVSGDIVLDTTALRIEAESVSGKVGLMLRGPVQTLGVETVSGEIEVDTALARGARVEVSTVSGEVTFALPAAIAADFDVSTFSGSIRNEFGPAAERSSSYAPGKKLQFSTGGGGADLTIESFSGAITLKKKM